MMPRTLPVLDFRNERQFDQRPPVYRSSSPVCFQFEDAIMARPDYTSVLVATLLVLLVSLFAQVHALTYAALGDSYAAGDGAGSPRLPPAPDFGCGRFSSSYPVVVSQDPALGINPLTGFLNAACGGASTTSVRTTQAPLLLGRDWDAVTVTVGGNEIDFFPVLNACVYGFYPVGNCEAELVRAREHVESGGVLDSMRAMIKGLSERVDGRVLVTGYARFFNEETAWCDEVSFSRREPKRYLTRSMRFEFNHIVALLNDVIRSSTEVYEADYVNIDTIFEGHRFCEEGGRERMNSNDTWFFNMQPADSLLAPEYRQQILSNPIKDFRDMTRAFHPTASGHAAIANKIAEMLLTL